MRGSSQALQKPYFRLTAAPDLATVRPPPVLKLALRHVQQHWIKVKGYSNLWGGLPVQQPNHFFRVAAFLSIYWPLFSSAKQEHTVIKPTAHP